jgi:hypothetical protein
MSLRCGTKNNQQLLNCVQAYGGWHNHESPYDSESLEEITASGIRSKGDVTDGFWEIRCE